jgi:hypothetical protein
LLHPLLPLDSALQPLMMVYHLEHQAANVVPPPNSPSSFVITPLFLIDKGVSRVDDFGRIVLQLTFSKV